MISKIPSLSSTPIGDHKFQITNNIKYQSSKLSFSGTWNLGIGACLEFDNWKLEIPNEGSV